MSKPGILSGYEKIQHKSTDVHNTLDNEEVAISRLNWSVIVHLEKTTNVYLSLLDYCVLPPY